MVVFSLYTIGRMEKHYSQPEKFQPERWIRNEERKKVNSYAYIPFSLGSRSCIGKKVAEAQMAFFISKVTIETSKPFNKQSIRSNLNLSFAAGQ